MSHRTSLQTAGRRPAICCAFLVAVCGFAVSEKDTAITAALRKPVGLTVSVFATHPQLANPVAIDVDTAGRVLVAEQYRFNRGDEENRTSNFFLDDDLQVQTLADRLAMFEKWAARYEGGMAWFSRYHDQIRLLTDSDGDGQADKTSVLAEFNEPLDGMASGVMAWGDDIWVTCIPNLWRLRGIDNDGKAVEATKVHTGFGVRASFLGHDLHGLAIGPDNRLYFSIGDRGFDLHPADGTVMHHPDQGGVFRCQRDGSGLELIHRGMRNPQEIAFDEWGNLYAGDNNCDKGDKSRLVYVIDGGDSGWRMYYQSVAAPYGGGPWMAEEMWRMDGDKSPLWQTRGVGYIGAGPSGLAYSAVGAWPEQLRNRFYHCNYTGNGGIETFRAEPDGAGFRLVEYKDFLKPAMISDCAFGYDGKLYAADYVGNPWQHSIAGRIYTVADPTQADAAKALRTLAVEKFTTFDNERLVSLLTHDDQRIRLRAQDELVQRGADVVLRAVAADATAPDLRRVHAIWGLWQLGLAGKDVPTLPSLAVDGNAEIRAQTLRVMGDLRINAVPLYRKALADESARVRYFAVRAIGRTGSRDAVPDLFALVKDSTDHFLQQAVVIALERIGDRDAVRAKMRDDSAAIRLTVLHTLRRWQDPAVAAFLPDADDRIALEAARAVHDLAIADTVLPLAQAGERAGWMKAPHRIPMLRRIIAANRNIGDRPAADRLMVLAGDSDDAVRTLTLDALASWNSTVNRDAVTGEWRPVGHGDAAAGKDAVGAGATALFADNRTGSWKAALQACQQLGVALPPPTLRRMLLARGASVPTQKAVFAALVATAPQEAAELTPQLLREGSAGLIDTVLSFLAESNPEQAIPVLARLAADDATAMPIRQSAVNALAKRDLPASRAALAPLFQSWRDGRIAPELLLEISEAAALFKGTEIPTDDPDKRTLFGGNAENGRGIFHNHQIAQCVRCHRIGSEAGGDAGPNLAGVAARLPHEQLLEAMINPSARIAPGFGVFTITRRDGTLIAGTVREETAEKLDLVVGDKTVVVPIADIASRSEAVSIMPPMAVILTPRERRDLVAFLATLK